MEDGLVLGKTKSIFEGAYVLILVVVDDGLVLVTKPISFWEERVLILVVVDNGLVHSLLQLLPMLV